LSHPRDLYEEKQLQKKLKKKKFILEAVYFFDMVISATTVGEYILFPAKCGSFPEQYII